MLAGDSDASGYSDFEVVAAPETEISRNKNPIELALEVPSEDLETSASSLASNLPATLLLNGPGPMDTSILNSSSSIPSPSEELRSNLRYAPTPISLEMPGPSNNAFEESSDDQDPVVRLQKDTKVTLLRLMKSVSIFTDEKKQNEEQIAQLRLQLEKLKNKNRRLQRASEKLRFRRLNKDLLAQVPEESNIQQAQQQVEEEYNQDQDQETENEEDGDSFVNEKENVGGFLYFKFSSNSVWCLFAIVAVVGGILAVDNYYKLKMKDEQLLELNKEIDHLQSKLAIKDEKIKILNQLLDAPTPIITGWLNDDEGPMLEFDEEEQQCAKNCFESCRPLRERLEKDEAEMDVLKDRIKLCTVRYVTAWILIFLAVVTYVISPSIAMYLRLMFTTV